MTRLLVLASTIVFVDTMFFAAVVPLLPGLQDDYGMSKTATGILAASYAAGTLIAALPAGWLATRIGPRRCVLVGLTLMSASGVAFALADSVAVLDVSRFVQGVGGACSWAGALSWIVGTAPADRRGEMIGTAMGAAIGGVLFGPVIGAAADAIGRAPVFLGVAIAGVGLIALVLATDPVEPRTRPSWAMVRTAVSSPRIGLGMWLILVPGMIFGTIEVLVPLRLDQLGATASAIAAVFLLASVLEGITAPVAGRVSDRRGRRAPILFGLATGAASIWLFGLPESAFLLGGLTVLVAPLIGTLWSPSMAMMSDGAEAAGVDLGLAFGFINLGWGLGHTIGATAGAALGEAVSDTLAYGLLAGLCAATLLALVSRTRPADALAADAV
jgi:MFS family permease